MMARSLRRLATTKSHFTRSSSESTSMSKPTTTPGTPGRPNFLVVFKINNPTVRESVAELQQRIVARLPETESNMHDPRSLHVTLCNLYLANEDEINAANRIIEEQASRAAEQFYNKEPPCFEVAGLEFFGKNDILHVGINQSSKEDQLKKLATLAESIHNEFVAAGFVEDRHFKRPYHAHITFWRTTKNLRNITRVNRGRKTLIQDDLATYLTDDETSAMTAHLGTERPTSIELVCMMEKPDGYYKVYGSSSLINSATYGDEEEGGSDSNGESSDDKTRPRRVRFRRRRRGKKTGDAANTSSEAAAGAL